MANAILGTVPWVPYPGHSVGTYRDHGSDRRSDDAHAPEAEEQRGPRTMADVLYNLTTWEVTTHTRTMHLYEMHIGARVPHSTHGTQKSYYPGLLLRQLT